MLLNDAIQFTCENRDSWSTGRGATTAKINANHCLRILGNISVDEIGPRHYAVITKTLKKEGKAPSTINRVTTSLSTIIDELRRNGYKLEKPIYKRQIEPKGRLEWYTDEDMDAMLMAALTWKDNFLMFDSILFAQKTGCRQSEMLKLEVDDVDFNNKTITFRDVKTAHATGKQDHIIKLHSDLEDTLERRIKASIDGYVFEWHNKDQLLREFRKVQTLAGVDTRMCWHHIRHTTATKLVSLDVPLKVIMGVLNHSSIDTTLRYAHAMDTSIAKAIDLL